VIVDFPFNYWKDRVKERTEGAPVWNQSDKKVLSVILILIMYSGVRQNELS
jgi:hypothetical protein